MTTVTLKARDAEGNLSTPVTVTINWQSAPTTTVVGAALSALPVAQTLGAFRYYTASWSATLKAQYANGTRVFVVSTKDTTPTNLLNMIKAAPADCLFYVTQHHEPDDDIKDGTLTPAAWGATMNTFGKAVASLPNVKFGPIHNGFLGKAMWVPDEAACDKSLWDFWGMDRYCFKYEDVPTLFNEGRDYAKSLGLPILVGECGAPLTDPVKQQKVATDTRGWAVDPTTNATVVCWWPQADSTYNMAFANAAVQHAFLG